MADGGDGEHCGQRREDSEYAGHAGGHEAAEDIRGNGRPWQTVEGGGTPDTWGRARRDAEAEGSQTRPWTAVEDDGRPRRARTLQDSLNLQKIVEADGRLCNAAEGQGRCRIH